MVRDPDSGGNTTGGGEPVLGKSKLFVLAHFSAIFLSSRRAINWQKGKKYSNSKLSKNIWNKYCFKYSMSRGTASK
jgi:hypothetical protein